MDSVSLVLTGQLPFVILASTIVALPVSLVLLALYRRAVVRCMSRGATPTSDLAEASPAASGSTRVEVAARELDPGTGGGLPEVTTIRAARRLALVYAAGGVVFALIMSSAVLASGLMAPLPVRVAVLVWVYLWPTVLVLNVVAPDRRRARTVGYALVLGVLAALAVALSQTLTLMQVAGLWLVTNGPASVLMFAFASRRVRAVGPMVLVVMICCFVGALLAIALAGSQEWVLRAVVRVGHGLGMGAPGTFAAIVLVGFALFAVVGWIALGRIRRAYEQRRITDQSMIVNSIWLLFAMVQSIGLTFEGLWWILAGPVAFASCALAVRLGLRITRGNDALPARSLLVLRVFALGQRSERLFDAISLHWRYLGPVRLIAGPDLATSTVEPQEFLEFLSGRLSRLFIHDRKVLSERLAEPASGADFDTRHRVEEFFCFDHTWEMVLSQLVRDADSVLMDLRSFSPENAGCIREIHELLNVADLERVVLVVDDSTDRAFLDQTLQQAARSMPATSPNLGRTVAPRLFTLGATEPAQIHALLRHLVASQPVSVTEAVGAQ